MESISRSLRAFTRFAVVALVIPMIIGTSARCADPPQEPPLSKWVESMKKSGDLKLEFGDPSIRRAHPGWTTFELDLKFKYDCEIKWPQKKPKPGKVILVTNITKIDVEVVHTIELPKVLESDRWYEAPLSRHELEHVRVGKHPRLTMLAKHVIKKLTKIERKVEKPDDVVRSWVQTQFESEMGLRRDAFVKLLRDTNDKIDKVTEHGVKIFEDREQFLANLFLKEHLDEMKFPYLAEAIDLIGSPEYLQATIQTKEFETRPTESDVLTEPK